MGVPPPPIFSITLVRAPLCLCAHPTQDVGTLFMNKGFGVAKEPANKNKKPVKGKDEKMRRVGGGQGFPFTGLLRPGVQTPMRAVSKKPADK